MATGDGAMVGQLEAGPAVGGAAVGARAEVATMQRLRRRVDQCVDGAAAVEGVVRSTGSRSRSPRLRRIASPVLAQRQLEGWAVEPVDYTGFPRQEQVGMSRPAPSGCCSSQDGEICYSTPCTNCVLCHMALCLEHARVCEDCPKPRWRLLCWCGLCMAEHGRRAHTRDLGGGRSLSLSQLPCAQELLRRAS